MEKKFCDTNHILVGLGGTGGNILKAFKMRMFEEFPDKAQRDALPISLLYVDSTDEMMPKNGRPHPDFRVMGQDASFEQREFLNIKSVDVSYILENIDNYPALKGIVKDANAVKRAIGNLGTAAGQMRRAGRLLFAANAVGYVNSLRNAAARCFHNSNTEKELFIHIFAGLCGGTGSGSIIDAIVQARKTFPSADIAVYAMLPEMHLPKADMDQGNYYANGYSAANELNALQTGEYKPHDVTGDGEVADFYNIRYNGVANGVTLYSNVNENGISLDPFSELPKAVSDYVYARVFFIKKESGEVVRDILRAYTFENCDRFPNEYYEWANQETGSELPVARTKKINSFGIKRVMYPELRILRHITYTIGESILYQFKYNNWREESGFVNEAANKDYRELYFNKNNLQNWMLDMAHLTLEKKVLPSDKDYPDFTTYWTDKAHGYAEDPTIVKASCPLTELDSLLSDFYDKQFRTMGVETFYKEKTKSLNDIAAEIRHKIEHELFEKWKNGEISIEELQKVSGMVLREMEDIKSKIEEAIIKCTEDQESILMDCQDNVTEWSQLGILQRMVNKGARIYARHQDDLADLYIERTRGVALQFAKNLVAKATMALQNMDSDIATFAQIVTNAIKETENMVSAQRKINRGLDDMKGTIIEVSEEEAMVEFEETLRLEKTDMHTIASQLRQYILPQGQFLGFGVLSQSVSLDKIRDAFDVKLSEIVRMKHDEQADSATKVLGMNILQQLQQQLPTDEDIHAFAFKIMEQSGIFLIRDNNQIRLQVRNNEGELAPTNTASINKKVIYVGIPKPENERQVKFAESLKSAFESSIKQGNERTTVVIDTQNPRTDEIQVISVVYCFPMRCAEWLDVYRKRYERQLMQNPQNNSILLHSEGDGKQLPPLFVQKENPNPQPEKVTSGTTAPGVMGPGVMGTVISDTIQTPPPPPEPVSEPKVSMFLFIGGQQYGPYDYTTLKQFVTTGQLTAQTMVWQQGMPAWTPAGQVTELQGLFAPAAPQMPPMPPTPGGMPPMPPTM